jgi:hypothetical protein
MLKAGSSQWIPRQLAEDTEDAERKSEEGEGKWSKCRMMPPLEKPTK